MGLYRPCPLASVRTPQPENKRGPNKWAATAFAFDLSTIPLQSRWPLFDVQRVDLIAVLVECEREVLVVGNPEIAVEASLQVGGLLLEGVGERGVLPDRAGQAGGANLGVVRVTLELARRAWEARDLAVA